MMEGLGKDGNFATTVVNVFEVLIGAYREKTDQDTKGKIRNFFDGVDVISLDKEIADEAAKIQALLMDTGELLEARDVLIGAVALRYNATIVTRNIRHFSRIKKLDIEEW
jgi:predicted nucleic acid-binding protein